MIVAEIGINHNGDIELAKELIRAAKYAGADVVKFQKRTVEKLYSEDELKAERITPWGKTFGEYKHHIEFGTEEYDEISRLCKELDIEWTASVWDEDAVDFLERYDVPYIKLPSAMLSNFNLLMKLHNCSKPVVISTGMATRDDVIKASKVIGENLKGVLHCVACYPTKDEDSNMYKLLSLQKIFEHEEEISIGYSGHETGWQPTLIAIALGANMIERHITLDKSMYGTDQSSSLTPVEFKQMVDEIKRTRESLGSGEIQPLRCEEEAIKRLKK